MGAARGTRNAIGITIGTGIGGGIIIDGKLYHGASDCAGEIGHTTIDTEGRRCKCGNYGCLEAYASGPNIALRACEELKAGAESRLPKYVGGDLTRITAQTVYQAAHDGDALAIEVVNDTAKFLGAGIANLLNIFNPEVVVVCGGVTLAGDHLFVPLRREVARRAFKPAVSVCRIVPVRADGHRGRLRCGQGIPGSACLESASSARWSGTSSTDVIPSRLRSRSGAALPTHWRDSTRACRPDWEIVPLIKVGRDLSARGAAVPREGCHG